MPYAGLWKALASAMVSSNSVAMSPPCAVPTIPLTPGVPSDTIVIVSGGLSGVKGFLSYSSAPAGGVGGKAAVTELRSLRRSVIKNGNVSGVLSVPARNPSSSVGLLCRRLVSAGTYSLFSALAAVKRDLAHGLLLKWSHSAAVMEYSAIVYFVYFRPAQRWRDAGWHVDNVTFSQQGFV